MADAPANPREILRRFPAAGEVRSIEPVGGGFSGAEIYRVETSEGPFALRGWPPDSLPPARIRGLHRVLASVFARGVSIVAVPLGARDGSTVIRECGRCWQLEPWMPGIADFTQDPSDARLSAAMKAIARWHMAAAGFDARPEEAEWFACRTGTSPAVGERLARIHRWQSGRLQELETALHRAPGDELRDTARRLVLLFHATAPAVSAELHGFTDVRLPLQTCLRDVWHDHVLFTGKEVTGLIDASACRTENAATDLARVLGSFLSDDFERWDFALAEYAKHRPLDDRERRLVRVLDRSAVLLSGFTWLERHFLGRGLTWDAPLLARLGSILQRLEHLGAEQPPHILHE